eukprot:GHRQ01031341.1.p1 GENE.GHRQ01031341.1~~GHRQ01031341.1.p1  ORF type:complete len:130 (+),score=9.25 GHRQ01031341.1:524-913(+)
MQDTCTAPCALPDLPNLSSAAGPPHNRQWVQLSTSNGSTGCVSATGRSPDLACSSVATSLTSLFTAPHAAPFTLCRGPEAPLAARTASQDGRAAEVKGCRKVSAYGASGRRGFLGEQQSLQCTPLTKDM